MVKSLEELALIREGMKDKIGLRLGIGEIAVVVGMGTAGIAAGAREVLAALVDFVAENGCSDRVTVMQSGEVGCAECAPAVEVRVKGKETVVYKNVTPGQAADIIKAALAG